MTWVTAISYLNESLPVLVVFIIIWLAVLQRDVSQIKGLLSNHITDTNKKIDDLKEDINKKIDNLKDDINKKIDDLKDDIREVRQDMKELLKRKI